MLTEVNFCLANVCNASCIYCPRSLHTAKTKFMPLELVQKIVDELKSAAFQNQHDVVLHTVGENGESTLHPNFIDALRIIKTAGHSMWLFSNFSKIKQSDLETILDEELISCFHINVDGSTPESYKAVKGIDFTAKENIFKLLGLRGSRKVSLKLHVITVENYIEAVKLCGAWPNKVSKDISFLLDEAEIIRNYWQKYLQPSDYIGIDDCILWAERGHLPVSKNIKKYECTNLRRVQECAYITPDGTWYACCLDVENKLAIGNVNESSLNDIYKGKKRKRLIEQLKNKEFAKIGSPCDRVDCCCTKTKRLEIEAENK